MFQAYVQDNGALWRGPLYTEDVRVAALQGGLWLGEAAQAPSVQAHEREGLDALARACAEVTSAGVLAFERWTLRIVEVAQASPSPSGSEQAARWHDEGFAGGVHHALRVISGALGGRDVMHGRAPDVGELSLGEFAVVLAEAVALEREHGAYSVALALGLADDEARVDGVGSGMQAIIGAVREDVLDHEKRAREAGRSEVREAFWRALGDRPMPARSED